MKHFSKWGLLFVLLLSLFASPAFVKASDDISGHYFERDMRSLISKGILGGYGNGSYLPNKEVTRAEFTSFLVRTLGVKTSESPLYSPEQTGSFSDVKADAWYYPAVMAASKEKIIGGYGDGSFLPNKEVSRQEMAAMIDRTLQAKGITSAKASLNFSDNREINSMFQASIQRLVSLEVIGGKSSGGNLYFAPKDSTTRAETSAILNRMLRVMTANGYKIEEQAPATQTPTAPKATGEKVVTADSLNVRSGPGTEYGITGKFPFGTKVATYNKSGDWVYVSSGTIKGYVHGYYLADNALANRTIAIDAGHGDHDPGASANGVVEKVVNLAVAKKTESYLKNAGVNVVMTRTDDTFISLGGRVDIAKSRGADTFVSIHTNAAGSSAAHGTETFYYTSATQRDLDSKQLATFIQKRLLAAWGTYDRGVKSAPFQVIKYNPLPSTLVELGFATNSSDAYKLNSDTYRDRAGKAIAQGIIDYYNWKAGR